MRYIEWDYDDMLAYEYERHGECNQCGDCCKSTITLKNGNGGTTEKGIWSEIDNGERIFFRPFKFELDKKTCQYYQNQQCSAYNNRKDICAIWPLSPRDVIMMPTCSYWFDEIDQWKIEE